MLLLCCLVIVFVSSSDDKFYYDFVKKSAIHLVETGFNAGSGYRATWIRDFNTFIELALNSSIPTSTIRNNLTVFFGFMDEENGFNTIDGFNAPNNININFGGGPERHSKYFPGFVGFKNTVEIDQETSLIQAVHKYIKITGDKTLFDVKFGDYTIKDRMELCMKGLLKTKYSEHYGLLKSGTRADWGDISPDGLIGSWINNKTHWSISVYDNAMYIIAMKNLIELFPDKAKEWNPLIQNFTSNVKKYLWDEAKQKFIPHIYLEKGSPFPKSILKDEDEIYYFGGTGIAIMADILDEEEIKTTIQIMRDTVDKAGAASVGLTLYPAYPLGCFLNPQMVPYNYQNGGDWSWFGGRIVQVLVQKGFLDEAVEFLHPMVERVFMVGEFWEWWTRDNVPSGSGKFKGSAGVLWKAIKVLEEKKK